jgi:sugar O-acyltransferase (sialic acid O-acetyltransferase NeuD family)
MAQRTSLVILGAGGSARETWWFARDTWPEVQIAFVDDVTPVTEVRIADAVVPVVKDWDFTALRSRYGATAFRDFIVGVAIPSTKRAMVAKALAHGLEPAPTMVHPRSIVRGDCRVGRGGQIVAHSLLTTDVTLGDYVVVLDSTIGHHDVVGAYTTCYPGCRVAGDVTLGEDCLLGTGTVIRPGLRIARGVVTGALSCLVKHVDEPDITLVGVPAKKLER